MLNDMHDQPNSTAPDQSSDEVKWRNTEELAAHKDFEAFLRERFPREAAILKGSGMDRRSFLKVMGASLTLAGFGLQGCSPAPAADERIIPYVRVPEGVTPGRPVFFASAMTLGGFANGVVIETQEGRPTRLDGNPNHPASLGGSSSFVQASILELYNPDRSVFVRAKDEEGVEGNRISSWEEFVSAVEGVLAEVGDGSGLRILTETVTSPTLASQLDALLERYPGASWYQYEPVARDSVLAGAQLAFGEVVNTVYRFDEANVVLSLDGDFLNTMPGSLRYARDFAQGRKVRGAEDVALSRLYAVESTPTNTGAMADHRLKLKPSQVETFALALADALGAEGGAAAEDAPWDSAWFEALVADLEANGGSSIVVPGNEQSPVVHALAHAINAQLGNVGQTVSYTEPVEANPVIQGEELTALVEEMNAGDVEALFILGGNPVYTAPADVSFADALSNVPFSAHLALYNDETSLVSSWHVPQTHYIEEWGDARAYDGTASIIQPPIGPLLDTVRSPYQMLALLLGEEGNGYEIVQAYWQSEYEGDEFGDYWRRALHNGVLEDTAAATVEPSLVSSFAGDVADAAVASSDGLELVFRPSSSVWDGRFAANAWLQELPQPLSKITWDNAALMSRATAASLGVSNEDLVELTFNGNTMMAPVWILGAHPDDVVTTLLGYGRGLSGDVEEGMFFNAYTLRTTDAPWFGTGLEVAPTGSTYELARVSAEIDPEIDAHSPVRAASLAAFLENPDFAQEESLLTEPSLLPEFDYSGGYAWGMTIDLNSCIGCNACMIACQSENNIPTVGKYEVARGREMHWIRVDQYYEEEEDHTYFQPVPCMHCEKAPCEQVCPVQATVHSEEGINQMIYNRCIGTRYCSANCPYGVRRFNFLDYIDEEPILIEQRNPEVSVRTRGVMEKCTYCVQRIKNARIDAGVENRRIRDDEVVPACASACPTQAIIFGDINDSENQVAQLKALPLNYSVLAELGTEPRTTYLARIYNPNDELYESDSAEE